MKIVTSETEIDKYICRNYTVDGEIQEKVADIVENVRVKGDSAILGYTELFDKVKLSKEEIEVTKSEIKEAYKKLSKKEISAIKKALKNIWNYQKSILPKEWIKEFGKGIKLGQLIRPLDRAGVYVPSGRYPLPSSALMNIVPAKVAGVKEIIVCTPPRENGLANPFCVVAADLAGADKIFKVGGAQAIAAMAFGTKSIPKVNKIVGPGNIYVTEAKRQVFGVCGIDMLAGPSEVMIIARKGNPGFIAADLLAQAEHDPNARAILLTKSRKLAKEVSKEVEQQLDLLKTREVARESIQRNSAVILVNSWNKAFDLANEFAPEHLELIGFSKKVLKKVRNAGAVFLGEYSCEALGDYCSGLNHVLPTNGFAKSRGGLSVLDFVKLSSIQLISEKGLKRLAETAEVLAEAEGLDAHKKAVEIRLEERK